ncbi:S8 family peptidase [Kibdelosporangium phytohabitans]|uniref:S8 family peptidase n=1 Tax=Kibdelosporangium phytohabitans TaxID=860235 RepID=UPI000AB1551A|nr:S8 family peptidase [Kibdelosporangium phytohabitans]MBE1461246.1 subtilisin family serine protease [Kibdelosporangium phytohabitans]
MRKTLGVGVAAIAAFAATAAPATAAEGNVVGAGADGAIRDSYIVVLKPGATTPAAGLAGRFGGRLGFTYQAINGFSVQVSERQAKRLAADPAVAYVEQDRAVRVTATQNNPPSWGLDRVDQRKLPLDKKYTYANTASNVNVYVIDTGVRATHKDFGGRVKQGYDFIDNDTNADDGYGHGTHVAGTIAGSQYGVAKGASIYPVRVLGNDGSGTTAGVIAGVNWITQNAKKPAVANASLGGGTSSTLDDAVRKSVAAGVTWVVAAGNSNTNADSFSPARVREAITVGATDKTDTRATYSNYGAALDLFAPGSGITSAWNTNDTATYTGNGTSFAAPHAAGAAALYLSTNTGATPAQVSQSLVAKATPGVVQNPGAGSPNRLLHTGP